jgi:hypothetical protein
MFFSFLGLRTLLGLLVRSGRGPDVKDIELMVLRPSGHVRRDTNNGALQGAVLTLATAMHGPGPA